jgi:hypothetical protein
MNQTAPALPGLAAIVCLAIHPLQAGVPVYPTGTSDDLPPVGGQTVHQGTLDFGALITSDILLTDELLEYRQTRPKSDWALAVYHGYIGLHYAPEPPMGTRVYSVLKDQDVEDQHYGFLARGRFQLGADWKLLAGTGAYEGFVDYRSLWLDQFYRQLEAGLSPRWGKLGYEKPDPWGAHVSTGLRWDYAPSIAYAQADLRYAYDQVAPGYNVNQHYYPLKLVPNADQLDTLSGRLTFENVLSSRLRALQEFQVTDTTDRELRLTLQSSLNWALAEHWVARFVLAGATEAPQFDAWWAGATVERDWKQTWFVSLLGRYYKDTGQYEQALPTVNNAAPPLETWQVGLGLRWQGQSTSARLVVGPYFSRYEPTRGDGVGSFANLYRDRDWMSVQFTVSHQF